MRRGGKADILHRHQWDEIGAQVAHLREQQALMRVGIVSQVYPTLEVDIGGTTVEGLATLIHYLQIGDRVICLGQGGDMVVIGSPDAEVPHCHVQRTTNQAVPTGGFGTAVSFSDAELWDNTGMHSTSTNPDRITVGIPGIYKFECSITFAGVAAGTYRRVYLWKNLAAGGSFELGSVNRSTAAGIAINGGVPLPMAVGDYVQFIAIHDRGANLNVTGRARAVWLGKAAP